MSLADEVLVQEKLLNDHLQCLGSGDRYHAIKRQGGRYTITRTRVFGGGKDESHKLDGVTLGRV